MFHVSRLEVQSPLSVTIPNTLFSQPHGADKLLVMLPGRGYTNEHPVMYYLRVAALNQGWDVLSVQYGFQVADKNLTADGMAAMYTEASEVLRLALERGYQHVCIAGKSLGTPLAVTLAGNLSDVKTSLILLTPIQGAAESAGLPRTLAVIGTADPSYSAEAVAKAPPQVTWRVFDHLNHSLESEHDWRTSLTALTDITAACEAFLSGDAG